MSKQRWVIIILTGYAVASTLVGGWFYQHYSENNHRALHIVDAYSKLLKLSKTQGQIEEFEKTLADLKAEPILGDFNIPGLRPGSFRVFHIPQQPMLKEDVEKYRLLMKSERLINHSLELVTTNEGQILYFGWSKP